MRELSAVWAMAALFMFASVPAHAPASPDGKHVDRLLIVNRSTHEVCFLTVPGFARIGCTSTLGHGPHNIAVSPHQDIAYVPNYGVFPERHHPLIAEEIVHWERQEGGSIASLNVDRATTFHVQDRLPGCDRPFGAATDGERLWISCEDSGRVLEMNARNWSHENPLRGWKLGKGVRQVKLAPGGQILAAANIAGTVTLIDLATEQMTTIEAGRGPWDMAFAPDGRRLFVLNALSDTLSIIDVTARKVIKTVPAGGRSPVGIAVAARAGEIWVSHNKSNDLTIYDLATLEQKQRLETRWRPLNLVLSGDEQWVFVTIPRRNEVWAYDAASRERRAVIPDMMEADGLAFVPAQ